MNKEKVKFILQITLYILSAILFVGFAIFVIVDCVRYDETWSAPLYAAFLLRGVEFLLPGFLALGGGLLLKKFSKK